TGATGYGGSRLVTALLADGHQVVAASRNPERLERLAWFDDVASVTFDATDPVSVPAAATNFAVAARDAGVRRIVYPAGFVPALCGQRSVKLGARRSWNALAPSAKSGDRNKTDCP